MQLWQKSYSGWLRVDKTHAYQSLHRLEIQTECFSAAIMSNTSLIIKIFAPTKFLPKDKKHNLDRFEHDVKLFKAQGGFYLFFFVVLLKHKLG